MKTITLSGRLGKEFGQEFNFDIASPAEAVRALCYQIKGFEEELSRGEYRVTKVYDKRRIDIDDTELSLTFGMATGLIIEPVMAGSKKSGLGKIILGTLLVFAAFSFAPMVAGTKMLSASLVGAVSYGTVAQLGIMMVLSGASSLLTPSTNTNNTSEDDSSFLIDATGNLVEQGNAVPVVFGEVFTGSVVISSGISSEDIPLSGDEDEVNDDADDAADGTTETPVYNHAYDR